MVYKIYINIDSDIGFFVLCNLHIDQRPIKSRKLTTAMKLHFTGQMEKQKRNQKKKNKNNNNTRLVV